MTNRLIDWDALAKACVDGDLAAFHAAALGWRLAEDARGRLLHAVKDTNFHCTYEYGVTAFTVAQALALISEAATNASGIAVTEQIRKLRLGKEVAIAFRHDGQVHFGVRYASNLPMTPSTLWPELKGWTKVLEKNRARLERWCATAQGNVSVPVDAAPAAPEAGAALGTKLLAAVLADPDDVGRRLVYADWLVEHNEAQGELIQLCERARTLPAPNPALERQIKALEAQYRMPIAGELAQLANSFTLSRGFVARITMAAPTFAKYGERLFAQHPIEELELRPVNASALARLATAPALRRLRRLLLAQLQGHLSPIPLNEIFESSLFDALTEIRLSTWITEGDPAPSLARMRAPRLESIALYDVDSAPRFLDGLARNPTLRLRDLDVTSYRARDWPAGGLASPSWAALERLQLAVDGPGLARCFDGATLPSLRRLDVRYGLALDRIHFPSLRVLRTDTLADAEQVFGLIARHPRLAALRIGTMEPAEVDRALARLVTLPVEHPLRALDLPTAQADPALVARAKERFGARDDDPALLS